MKHLKMAATVALFVLLNPAYANANGMWALEAIGHASLAGVVGCIVVALAIWIPRSKGGLVGSLVVGGILGAAASLYVLDANMPLWLVPGAILMGSLVTGGANRLPRSIWGLLCFPLVAGLIAETSIALLYVHRGNILGIVLSAGIVIAVLGGFLGLVGVSVTTVVRKSKEKSHSEDSPSGKNPDGPGDGQTQHS